jgi:hypothetical protein
MASYRPLYIGGTDDSGGRCVILFPEDDDRALALAPGDSVMIELEEWPASGQRWHVVGAPPGFVIAWDRWISDGTFTKKGPRKVKHQNDPATRRIIINVDFGAEPGEIRLELGPEQSAQDGFGFAQILPQDVAGHWSVLVDDVDLPLLEQCGLPGRAKGQPLGHKIIFVGGPRARLSALALPTVKRQRVAA